MTLEMTKAMMTDADYKRYGCALKKYWFLSEKHKEMRTGSWFEITSR